jgi:hypothetical protein
VQYDTWQLARKGRKRPIGSQIKSNTPPGFGLPVSGPKISNLNLLIVQVPSVWRGAGGSSTRSNRAVPIDATLKKTNTIHSHRVITSESFLAFAQYYVCSRLWERSSGGRIQLEANE